MPATLFQQNETRSRAMSAFAAATTELLRDAWTSIGVGIDVTEIRGPEIGLVMLRGRIGGGGMPFNLGEATVTRATVKLGSGEVGHAVVLGRDPEKAKLAASLDAAWHKNGLRHRIEAEVIEMSLALASRRDSELAEKTEATRVDFFTLVRGEDR